MEGEWRGAMSRRGFFGLYGVGDGVVGLGLGEEASGLGLGLGFRVLCLERVGEGDGVEADGDLEKNDVI